MNLSDLSPEDKRLFRSWIESLVDGSSGEICERCGFTDCPRKAFEDSRPEWVGGNITHYEELAEQCRLNAETLGERFAVVWRAARTLALSLLFGVSLEDFKKQLEEPAE